MPSFDTGAGRVTSPGRGAFAQATRPGLERQHSLDWFRVKEGEGKGNQMLSRQASIDPNNLGPSSSTEKEAISSQSSSEKEAISSQSSSSPGSGSKRTASASYSSPSKKAKQDAEKSKSDSADDGNGGEPINNIDENPVQALSLLGRNQNLTLCRIDSIEQAVRSLISDTPREKGEKGGDTQAGSKSSEKMKKKE